MNTAPWWLPRPGHCCSGNTGFGSQLSTRYTVVLTGLEKTPRIDITSGSHSLCPGQALLINLSHPE